MTIPVLQTMDKLAHGIHFCSPHQTTTYKCTTKMFIDDKTTYSNKFHQWLVQPPSDTTVLDMLKHDAQTWERCLWTSGGKLKLYKCHYYILMWDFHDNGSAQLCPASQLPTLYLHLQNSNSPYKNLQQDCSKAHISLCYWNAPNNTATKAANILHQKGQHNAS